jgi:IMP dehydrogenase/GMP reductase
LFRTYREDDEMRIVQNSLTFDDVLLVPARSSVLPREANLAARLTRNVALKHSHRFVGPWIR